MLEEVIKEIDSKERDDAKIGAARRKGGLFIFEAHLHLSIALFYT